MAGNGSRAGSSRSAGGKTAGPASSFDNATLQRRVERAVTTVARRQTVERNNPSGAWRLDTSGMGKGQKRYAIEKAIRSDARKAASARRTEIAAQQFMRSYGTASTYGSRPRLQTRDSERFNSKPGGKRPRTSRQSLANRRMADSQRAWNSANGRG